MMSNRIILGMGFLIGNLLFGCEFNGDTVVVAPDDTAPGVPRGVYTVTGDRAVTVYWFGSSEDDLDEYLIWRADNEPQSSGDFFLLAVVGAGAWDPDNPDFVYVDRDDVANGHTYYYAISATDFAGNESALSYASDPTVDTPRPEGEDVLLDADVTGIAGFDIEHGVSVPIGHPSAHIEVYYDDALGILTAVAVYNNSSDYNDIQDFGYTDDMDQLDWAPEQGWSHIGWAELIEGHTYVVWTNENHFAKFRVTSRGDTWVLVDWAYQLVAGLPELKPALPQSDGV
jgi:hypothetical protein